MKPVGQNCDSLHERKGKAIGGMKKMMTGKIFAKMRQNNCSVIRRAIINTNYFNIRQGLIGGTIQS